MTSLDDVRTRLAERYLATFPDKLADLRRALADGDVADLRRQAHRLAGSGASYGFADISTRATELELAAGDAVAAAAEALIAALEAAAG